MEKSAYLHTKHKVLTALLSTSVLLASAPLPSVSAKIQDSSLMNDRSQETSSADGFRQIVLDNGSLSLTLDDPPSTLPSEDDFSVQLSLNGKPLSLRKDSFQWDQETGTAWFFFRPVAAKSSEQTLSANIVYGEYHAEASSVFAPKNEEVAELELINLSNDNQLSLDGDLTLRALPKDSQGRLISKSNVEWESSNKEVVTVDHNGRVTAVGEGSAEILATAGDVTARYSIKVDSEDEETNPSSFYATNGLVALQFPEQQEAEPTIEDFALFVSKGNEEKLTKLTINGFDWLEENNTVLKQRGLNIDWY